MNPEIKKLWVADLRANADKQGRGALAKVAEDGFVRYCCLGRLCELAVAAGVIKRRGVLYGGNSNYPNHIVAAWAGLKESNPPVRALLRSGHFEERPVAHLNDCGYSFAEIADLVEAQL